MAKKKKITKDFVKKSQKVELKTEEIQFGKVIKFIARTKDWGVASFDICVKYNYGKIIDVWIYPTQQNIKKCYHLKVPRDYNKTAVWFNAFTHQGLEYPWLYNSRWCKEHKAITYCIYVAKNSSKLIVDNSLEYVDLRFEK